MRFVRMVTQMVLLSGLLFALTSCNSAGSRWDAVSGATWGPPNAKPAEVELPPPSDTYEVIGVMPGLVKFVVRYSDGFYRGGAPLTEEAAASLHSLGIRTIISVTPDDFERELCKKHGFKLIEIPFDKEKGPSEEDIKRFVAAVQTEKLPVYAHCYGGSQRGGVLGALYRTEIQDWSAEKAIAEYDQLGGDPVDQASMLKCVQNSSCPMPAVPPLP